MRNPLAALLIACMPFATTAQVPADYPPAPRGDAVDTYFGTTVPDPWRWLEDANAPATRDWVAAQNRVTDAYLAAIPGRDALRERIAKRVDYMRYGLSGERNGYLLFTQNTGLQNQAVLMGQQGFDGKPELLVDPNTLSADGTTMLKGAALSRDARYLAYAVSPRGADWLEIRILDRHTGQTLPERIEWVKFGGATWRGSDGFYYPRYPKPEAGQEYTASNRNQQVWFHRVGTPQSADVLVWEDKAHPARAAWPSVSEDGRHEFLSVITEGRRGNALLWRRAGAVAAPWSALVPDIGEDQWQPLDTRGDDLLLKTNAGAPNWKLLRHRLGGRRPVVEAAVLLAERPEPLGSAQLAGGRLFATWLKDANTHAEMLDADTGRTLRTVALPGLGTAAGFDGEPGSTAVRYVFSSYNQPATLYRYDIASGRSTVWKAPAIAGFDPADYTVEQVFATSKDGTRVPAFVVAKRGLPRDGQAPTILYGYGGFNVPLTPSFSAMRLEWLDAGGVFVVANLRGGSEYGERWHEGGMRHLKQNVFDDAIAVAEHLVALKITSPARLAIQGGSNGGLLVGAVINQRPDLFAAAVPQVGVMDMLRYQRFTAGQFWVAEYGSAEASKADFDTLFAYSPLHNIRPGGRYPAVLVTTSDFDDRVVPAHSYKYAAALQATASRERPLLIRIATNAAHGGSSLTKSIEETADIHAFLWHSMQARPAWADAMK